MTKLFENINIKNIAGSFLRSPIQLNSILEADSELIEINQKQVLAITYDAIVEEIDDGLYTDPYLIGWMVVTISVSDLAAVSAQPLGLLLDFRIPSGYESYKLKTINKGINDACSYYNCFIYGGDTNKSDKLQLGSTGVGLCEKSYLKRVGMQPNDVLYVSGKMGMGSSYAYSKFFNNEPIDYLPKARISEGQFLRNYATSCIDSSDGFIPAICQLMDINNLGFSMDLSIKEFLHESCFKILKQNNFPDWIFLAGPHGEYELVFTIGADKVTEFEEEANLRNWHPIRLGKVIDQRIFKNKSKNKNLDPFAIANVYSKKSGLNPEQYLLELLRIHKEKLL